MDSLEVVFTAAGVLVMIVCAIMAIALIAAA